MLDSQWLEVAIGLVLTFFLISLASSMIVEVVARVLSKRASDLERAVRELLGGHCCIDRSPGAPWGSGVGFGQTRSASSSNAAARRRRSWSASTPSS